MAIYLIDVSTKHPEHDYGPLWLIMDSADAKRALDTTWFVESDQSVQEITEAVSRCLDHADRFFVVEIVRNAPWAAVRLEHDTALWLRSKRP